MPITRILATTDFSPSAEAAVRRAALLARDNGSELEIAHAIHVPPLASVWLNLAEGEGMTQERLHAVATERLGQLVAAIGQRFGVVARACVLDGKAPAAIAARARESGADLIVVGAHGENLLLDLFVGTTSLKLLRLASQPVLVVRHPPAASYECLLVATDFSPAAATAANFAADLLPQATLDLFHAYEVPFERQMYFAGSDDETVDHYRRLGESEAKRQIEAFAGTLHNAERFGRKVRHGYAPNLIAQYAAAAGADLLVLGAHRQSELEVGLLGSVAAHLVNESRIDVLLVPWVELAVGEL